jgi:hypothetical protein
MQGDITNNVFNVDSSGTSTNNKAYGLKINGDFSGNINFNDFTVVTVAEKKAYGIYFELALQHETDANNVTNNNLTVTAGGTDNAIGISLADDKGFANMKVIALINTFNGTLIDEGVPPNAVENRNA